jgi:hypothetical protein
MGSSTVILSTLQRISLLGFFLLQSSLAAPVFGQRFAFGVKAAGQITKVFGYPGVAPDQEDKILFGPTGEIRLGRSLSLELDALYKRSISNSYQCCIDRTNFLSLTTETIDEKFHSWELPLILQWRIPDARIFRIPITAGAGFAARHMAGTSHTYGTQQTFFPVRSTTAIDFRSSPQDLINPWTYGPVVAAGFDVQAGRLHFHPELRYTRWNASPFSGFTKPDSLQALFGIVVGK